MASSIEICNDALTMLSQEPVMALDDTTKASRLCKQRYEPVRDALLRSYPWSFAMHEISNLPLLAMPTRILFL